MRIGLWEKNGQPKWFTNRPDRTQSFSQKAINDRPRGALLHCPPFFSAGGCCFINAEVNVWKGYTFPGIDQYFSCRALRTQYFCVFLLMALGLRHYFRADGVVNMAHGEFLTFGAYTTYLISEWVNQSAPALCCPIIFHSLSFVRFNSISAWLAGGIRTDQRTSLQAAAGYVACKPGAWADFATDFPFFVWCAREVGITLPEWFARLLPACRRHRYSHQWHVCDGRDIGLYSRRYAVFCFVRWESRCVLPRKIASWPMLSVSIPNAWIVRLCHRMRHCGCCLSAVFTTIASTGPTTGSLSISSMLFVVVFWRRSEFVRYCSVCFQYCAGAIRTRIFPDWLNGKSHYLVGGGRHFDDASTRPLP